MLFRSDGDKAAGTILNLKFNDGTLCPGTRMYVSAWINNLGTGSNPNLNFSVIGIRADGTQHVISTYTTGDLDASVTRGEWHQLFFTLNMPNIDYVDYRLHVMNNAQTALGNDFAIDDICVYMQKPALMAYQADVDCSQSNDESVVMVRIDYNTLNAIPTDEATKIKSIYYQFQDEDGIALSNKAYINNQGRYGKVDVVIEGKFNYPVFEQTNEKTALDSYLDSLENNASLSKVFYVTEKDERGNDQKILYLYHNVSFAPGSTYYCVLSADESNFHLSYKSCGLVSRFSMQPNAKLIVNNRTMDNMNVTDLCANQYNGIRLEVYGSKSSLTEVMAGNCKADWLEGRKEDYSANGKFGSYNYQTV